LDIFRSLLRREFNSFEPAWQGREDALQCPLAFSEGLVKEGVPLAFGSAFEIKNIEYPDWLVGWLVG
jgi:hypothetical protein